MRHLQMAAKFELTLGQWSTFVRAQRKRTRRKDSPALIWPVSPPSDCLSFWPLLRLTKWPAEWPQLAQEMAKFIPKKRRFSCNQSNRLAKGAWKQQREERRQVNCKSSKLAKQFAGQPLFSLQLSNWPANLRNETSLQLSLAAMATCSRAEFC